MRRRDRRCAGGAPWAVARAWDAQLRYSLLSSVNLPESLPVCQNRQQTPPQHAPASRPHPGHHHDALHPPPHLYTDTSHQHLHTNIYASFPLTHPTPHPRRLPPTRSCTI